MRQTVWASSDPTAGASAWSPARVAVGLAAVSCATAAFWVLTDTGGDVISSTWSGHGIGAIGGHGGGHSDH